jgi:hypothetical protein
LLILENQSKIIGKIPIYYCIIVVFSNTEVIEKNMFECSVGYCWVHGIKYTALNSSILAKDYEISNDNTFVNFYHAVYIHIPAMTFIKSELWSDTFETICSNYYGNIDIAVP